MKKVLLAAIVATMALAFAPSHAAVPATPACGDGYAFLTPGFNGTDDGEDKADESCTFTSTGADIEYLHASPNHFSIVVTYVQNGQTKVRAQASGDSADPAAEGPGTVTGAVAGDKVTVTLGNDCAVICGQGGFLIAGENPA